MNIYIPFSILLILWCYNVRKSPQKVRNVFGVGMALTCIFASIRYEFGPDYFTYHAIYENIHGQVLEGYNEIGQSIEKPFLIFLSLFPNFTSFIVLLTVTWFAANMYLFKKYIRGDNYWFLVFFLFFNTSFLLGSLVAMRTTICATLFIIAFELLVRGYRLPYVAIILLASLIHTSAIVLLFFCFLVKSNNSFLYNRALLIVLSLIALASVIVGTNFLVDYLALFVMDNFEEMERYANYGYDSVGQSVFSFIFKLMLIAIMFYVSESGRKEKDPKYIIMYNVGFLASVLQLVFSQNIVSDRYMSILNPIYIIVILRSLPKNRPAINHTVLLFIAVSISYIFFQKIVKDYSVSFLTYHSIFSAPTIP